MVVRREEIGVAWSGGTDALKRAVIDGLKAGASSEVGHGGVGHAPKACTGCARP